MKSICFFNNKGGVGKTTLACNVAASMAEYFEYSVLLIDADPQCNATQLMLSDKLVGHLYPRTGKPPKTSSNISNDTLFDVLRPIAKGESAIKANVKPVRAIKNRFRVDILPGHPRVSLLEDRLSQSWIDFGSGDVGGARRTNWANSLVYQVLDDYDIVIFDVGPSLGALNRSVLIGADFFITPMGCDIFSLMGISNIAEWLGAWRKAYDRSIHSCKEQWGEDINEFEIRDFHDYPFMFSGFTIQQYVAKTIRGERRPTKAYEQILSRIPATIERELKEYFPKGISESDLRLGDVPNMYSLVPLAQDSHVPIHGILSKDGLVGAQYSQQDKYSGFIKDLTKTILNNIGLPVD